MPQSSHNPAAEQHNLATHVQDVAAVAHGKADHLSAQELSNQEHEISREEQKRSEELDTATKRSVKPTPETGEQVKAVHVSHPGLPNWPA